MFKGKKSLYILAPINLLVWGFVGYKIYMALNEESGVIPQEFSISKSKFKMEDSIQYKLSLSYADPFLKEEPKTHYKSNNSSNKLNQPANSYVNPKQNINPPANKLYEIKYLGLIQNKTSGITTGLISINGKSYVVKKGETIEGILIKSIDGENLTIKEGKNTSQIKK